MIYILYVLAAFGLYCILALVALAVLYGIGSRRERERVAVESERALVIPMQRTKERTP